MSVRIYELSKKIGMENSELISLLKERGYLVKSASSTIDNISAESLVEEYANKQKEPEPSVETDSGEDKSVKVAEESNKETPAGAVIRTREEIEAERRKQEEEKERQAQKAKMTSPVSAPPPVKASQSVPAGKAAPNLAIPITTKKKPSPRAPISRPPSPPVIKLPATSGPSKAKEKKEEIKVPSMAPPVSAPPKTSMPPRGSFPSAPAQPPSVKVPPMTPPPVSVPPKPPVMSKSVREGSDPSATEEGAVASEVKKIQVKPPIVVRDFAMMIGKKPFQLISELMEMNIFASMHQVLKEDVAIRIAQNHGIELEIKHRGEGAVQKDSPKKKGKVQKKENQQPRPPVICILGHVDHGKTTLLDTIRKANVVAGEAGGITQHIGAYQIEHNNQKISFIDTPGHAAFSNMRARGANTTDIAILVVAADDGFMPQTDEALGHAQVAKVPIVVAINKIDMPGANIDRVKRQMQERGIASEDWGGEILTVPVSAIKGDGIEDLLDAVLLQAEMMETLMADPTVPAEGVILEAQKEVGRGSTASVIVQKGTLKRGDALVCGPHYCRVRALIDDKGRQLKSAPPSTPVNIMGWSGAPDAGQKFTTVKNEREAKRIAENNAHEMKMAQISERKDAGNATIDDLFAAIAQTKQKVFKVIVKADVYGTAEALAISLEQIESDKIALEVVDMGVGAISRNDILMASAAEAYIVGFNVNLENGVQAFAKHHGIEIYQHNIIYELINLIKDAMADQLEPELRENKLGVAAVRQVFPLSKGTVAGCMVTEGRIIRMSMARLLRNDEILHEGKISTLKRFKDDATEVRAGYECGIRLDGFDDYREGDMIEAFEIQKIKPAL